MCSFHDGLNIIIAAGGENVKPIRESETIRELSLRITHLSVSPYTLIPYTLYPYTS